jgi:Bacterial Ig-like domain/RTX calcium-binding nonapeptide repeat (4 copies)/NHL repeat
VCAESYRSRTAIDDPPTASRVARVRRRVVGRALLAPLVLAAFFSVPAGSASATPTFDLTWGSVGTGNGQFTLPQRVATDSTGAPYVSDTGNHRIQKFTNLGAFTTKWGATVPIIGTPIAGTGNGEFNLPAGVATDSSNSVYVADTNNNRIQKFTSAGAYTTQWGSVGTGNGQFSLPQGIATDSSNNVYVADTGNNRIQKFNSTGTYMTQWGSAGTGNGQFASPSGVAVDSSGNVYVADAGNTRIQKFNSTGTFITKWGSAGTGNGQFGATTTLDVATGSHDNVIVADTANNRIQKFRPSGTFITTWGTLGTATSQFNGPSGVAVDSSHAVDSFDYVYVVDRANNRIQKFHEPDIIEPTTTIDSGPSGLTNNASPSFTFSSNEALLTPQGFECSLDAAEWASCASPKAYSSLADGAHTFQVRAVDAAGNPDLSPDSRSFTVDATPPDTTLDSGPSDPTNDATPTFSFSSEPGASFQCRFDLGSFGACSGPGDTHTPASALGEGSHTFYVRAVDAAGNPDPSPDSQTFTVDTIPPNTGITSGPTGPTNDPTPTFGFNASQPGSTFECRFDSDDFEPCSGPGATHTPSTDLADGFHTFEVQATDPAGNTDPSPDSQGFTVDTLAPNTTITGGPTGPTNDATPTFTFSSQPGSSFECRFDSDAFAPCSGPGATHTPSTPLADGSHTFYVKATDPAGNPDTSPDSRSFTVDATPPNTTITGGPTGPTNDATPTFTFQASEAGSTFQCRVDSGTWTACTSPNTTSLLADGSHTFKVRATDPLGNLDPTPAARMFTVDTTPTDTIIDTGPSGLTNDPTPTFTFHATEPGSSFRCKLNSGTYSSCTSPETTFHLSDGARTFYVQAVDQAGNADPTPASRSFTVRTAAIHVSGSTLVVTAAAGAKDNFSITRPSASILRVTDAASGTYTGSGVHAWAGCNRSGDYGANCSAAGITLIQVASLGLSDKVVNSTTIQSSLAGGAANDFLQGGPSNDTLTGGGGQDVLMGMNGNDQLFARDLANDTTIDCGGSSGDKADMDVLPKDSSVSGCETETRH